MTSRKRKPNKNSANAERYTDAVYENPPAKLADLPLDTVEQYVAGYEEDRVEKLEKWMIVNDNS